MKRKEMELVNIFGVKSGCDSNRRRGRYDKDESVREEWQ